MDITYGQGTYLEGSKHLNGQIVLSEHKLYLKNDEGDIAPTFVPLEKIEVVKKSFGGEVKIQVRPSLTVRYTATIKGNRSNINGLVQEIVKRRGLKKKFLKNEWVEEQT